MTQTDVVEGFLRASASFDDDHAVARSFLAPETAASVGPEPGRRDLRRRRRPPGRSTSRATCSSCGRARSATITPRGEYAAAATDSVAKAHVLAAPGRGSVAHRGPPRRAAAHPARRRPQLPLLRPVLPRPDLDPPGPERDLRPGGSVRLDEPGHRAARRPDGLARPGRAHARSRRDRACRWPSAPVQDGVVQVDLDSRPCSARPRRPARRSRRSSCGPSRQLPDVSAVRITAGRRPAARRRDRAAAATPGRSSRPTARRWATPTSHADGRLVRLDRRRSWSRCPASWATGASRPRTRRRRPRATSSRRSRRERDRLYLTAPTADAPVRTRLTATDLTPPSWDPFGTRVDGRAGAPRARSSGPSVPATTHRVASTHRARRSARRRPAGRPRRRARRDRRRDDADRAQPPRSAASSARPDTLDPRRPAPASSPASSTWPTSRGPTPTGWPSSGRSPTASCSRCSSHSDGTVNRASGSLSGPVRIAAAPGQPLVAATADGTLWLDTAVGWQPVGKGSDPAYPG